MIKTNKVLLSSFSAILILASISLPSHAEQSAADIMPPTTQAEADEATNDDILRITPDKSELIRFEEEIGSIIIGNPLHINAVADSSKTLVIIPRTPGATHFTVLNKDGEVLLKRHVIVASPEEEYIRVKRVCAGGNINCQETSVFYCPDMCHEIGLKDQGEAVIIDKTPRK